VKREIPEAVAPAPSKAGKAAVEEAE
jgi:hypothetical protein